MSDRVAVTLDRLADRGLHPHWAGPSAEPVRLWAAPDGSWHGLPGCCGAHTPVEVDLAALDQTALADCACRGWAGTPQGAVIVAAARCFELLDASDAADSRPVGQPDTGPTTVLTEWFAALELRQQGEGALLSEVALHRDEVMAALDELIVEVRARLLSRSARLHARLDPGVVERALVVCGTRFNVEAREARSVERYRSDRTTGVVSVRDDPQRARLDQQLDATVDAEAARPGRVWVLVGAARHHAPLVTLAGWALSRHSSGELSLLHLVPVAAVGLRRLLRSDQEAMVALSARPADELVAVTAGLLERAQRGELSTVPGAFAAALALTPAA